MKLALIGIGQAGGKIVDAFLDYELEAGSDFVADAIAINTAKADLAGLDRVPERNRVLVGQSRVKGHGVGADNELGAEIASENIDEIQGALDTIPAAGIDGFLLVAALGGGTGSGAGPVIARELKRIYTEPVYALGILPAADEGGIYTFNAARSFQTFVREADSLLMFDNDAWRESGESIGGGYNEINEEIARRFGVLFSAGQLEGADAQSVVDSSEIINTLAGGGISTIGYATGVIDDDTDEGLLSKFSRDDTDQFESVDTTNAVTSLIRKAALGRLTLPCELASAERALVVVSGPPDYLSRKGIERGRKWLEEQTGSMEVRGGDYPILDEDKLAAVVLLSGVTEVPRIDQLQRTAVEAQDVMDEAREESEAELDELIEDDALDALF